MASLKQAVVGPPVADLCREHGKLATDYLDVAPLTGGTVVSFIARMKEVKLENGRLDALYV